MEHFNLILISAFTLLFFLCKFIYNHHSWIKLNWIELKKESLRFMCACVYVFMWDAKRYLTSNEYIIKWIFPLSDDKTIFIVCHQTKMTHIFNTTIDSLFLSIYFKNCSLIPFIYTGILHSYDLWDISLSIFIPDYWRLGRIEVAFDLLGYSRRIIEMGKKWMKSVTR